MKKRTALPVIRNYKDTLFRKLFSDKNNLLSLYNVMSGKHYTNPELLEIVTLDNAIYMNMKNDLAFVIDCSIYMCEHQSTLSPNLALRHLFYVAREYEKLTNQHSLYSTKGVTLPAPFFIVFYNGRETDWDVREQKLSDLFEPVQDAPNLELIVKEFNINLGVNDEMLGECKPLFEYMQLIDKIRSLTGTMDTALAVERAVNESIKEGILADFLLKNKSEAIQMSIFEFDEEREMKLIRADEREIGREEGREEGRAEGHAKGREEGRKEGRAEGREEGRKEGRAEGREEGRTEGICDSVKSLIHYELQNNLSSEAVIQKVVDVFGWEAREVSLLIQNMTV